mgnify:CR=1
MAAIWTQSFAGLSDGSKLHEQANWSRNALSSNEVVSASGKLYSTGPGGVQHVRTGDATTDGEYHEATIDVKSATGSFGVGVRLSADGSSGYFFIYIASQWRLYVLNSNSFTQIGSGVAASPSTGTRTMRLQVTGTSGDPQLTAIFDGANPFGGAVAHSTGGTKIYTLGKAGYYHDTAVSSTTGLHLASSAYEDGSAGGTAPGIATETDAALALSGKQIRAAGMATETDTALALVTLAGLPFNTAPYEFGQRTGLDVAAFSLHASTSLNVSVYAATDVLLASQLFAYTESTGADGRLTRKTHASLTAGTTYIFVAVTTGGALVAAGRITAT